MAKSDIPGSGPNALKDDLRVRPRRKGIMAVLGSLIVALNLAAMPAGCGPSIRPDDGDGTGTAGETEGNTTTPGTTDTLDGTNTSNGSSTTAESTTSQDCDEINPEGSCCIITVGGRDCCSPDGLTPNKYGVCCEPGEGLNREGLCCDPNTEENCSVMELERGSGFNQQQIITIMGMNVAPAVRIPYNLDNYVAQDHTLEEALTYGLTGKVKGSEEYELVMEWYNKALAAAGNSSSLEE